MSLGVPALKNDIATDSPSQISKTFFKSQRSGL
jgi:hypothetical protein